MSLMDILRKLNIVRYGTKAATYRNAKDRPLEFMVDNVYNAGREVINLNASAQPSPTPPTATPPVLSTTAAAPSCPKCGAGLPPGAKFCSACGAATAVVPPTAPQKSSSKLVGCLITGVVGFVLLAVLLVGLAIIGSKAIESKETVDSKPVSATVQPVATIARETPAPAAAPAAPVSDSIKPAAPAAPSAATAASAGNAPGAVATSQPSSTGAVRYDIYTNPKFGFVTELPAHWESEVKGNSHVFSGPKGAEDYRATINFQFIAMTSANSLPQQRRMVIDQWRRMQDYRLVEDETHNFQNQYLTVYLRAVYRLPGSEILWEQAQVIVERPPYYYCIAYTAPQPIFEKYHPHMKHLFLSLRFTPIAQ